MGHQFFDKLNKTSANMFNFVLVKSGSISEITTPEFVNFKTIGKAHT